MFQLKTILLLFICVHVRCARATDCKDAGVVVVASIFATLAVVFIVLGIVGFLIWKRRRDIARPEKFKNDATGSSPSSNNDKYGYNNPAFANDPEMGESGAPGYVPCMDKSTDNKKTPGKFPASEMAQKTWSSLPGSNIPYGRSRKSSTGSLDMNNYNPEDNMVEVWLTSQDFIGLGFNIAGSMRDGIFVSQVHNRGPANESGKFKVGDRIMSVSISFENMVYEDALTILSYASPYPVKVTLQKEQQLPKNRRLSEVKTNLNHPLYRSQSVDAVNAVHNDALPVFHPKRAASEMRYDRRNSPKTVRTSKGGDQADIMEEISKDEVFHKSVPSHRPQSDKEKLTFDREVSIPTETDLPVASVDLNIDIDKKPERMEGKDGPDANFTDVFKNLTEQDKLDVLMLSYDDPNGVINKPFEGQKQVVEAEINHQAVNSDLKSIPIKPERKKKRDSSASHSDAELPDSNFSSPVLASSIKVADQLPSSAQLPITDDVFEISMAPPTEAPPPLPDPFIMPDVILPTAAPPPVPDLDTEAQEEMILPQSKQRNITVNSEGIVLSPMKASDLDVSDISIDKTVLADVSGLDDSFSELNTTLIPSTDRANSPGGDVVVEDEISATHVKKDEATSKASVSLLDKITSVVTNSFNKDNSSHSVKTNNKEEQDQKLSQVYANGTEGAHTSDDDFEKELPSLDMNLNLENFGNESVLFQEQFPSRNERENEGGLAYDISVTELESMERMFRDDERAKKENQIGKGGIAFEVRDDFESGTSRTVTTKSVHRTASYEIQSSNDVFITREISQHRPTSLKGDIKRHDDDEVGMFDWSGKRLVRSDSFSEIPQADSVKDWTDDKDLNEEDLLLEKRIEEDAKSPALKALTKATMLQSNQKHEPLSDSDSQCRSLSSPSSSGSSSPNHRISFDGTNGEDDGLGMSPEGSPIKITPTPDFKSELITNVSRYEDNDQSLTVTINTADDEDC